MGVTRRALAIGTFDGVHLGHQQIIAQARRAAGDDGVVTAVTFWPHPQSVFDPAGAPPLLQSLDARRDALRAAGADEIRLLDFTPALAAMSPPEFVDQMLWPLRPVAVCVGANFTFGARGLGTPASLTELAGGRFSVQTGDLVQVGAQPVSSSAIRSCLLAGEAGAAAALLGRDFALRGEVVHGDHRGRQLGFPTANLLPPRGYVTPGDGVYAGWLRLPGDQPPAPAAISVGDNPTFHSSRRVEAHVLGADIDLYGATVEIGFSRWLRPMVTYSSVDALVAQLRADVAATAAVNDSCPLTGTW